MFTQTGSESSHLLGVLGDNASVVLFCVSCRDCVLSADRTLREREVLNLLQKKLIMNS